MTFDEFGPEPANDNAGPGVVAGTETAKPMPAASKPVVLTKAQFAEGFNGMFNMGGAFTGLESLPIAPTETQSARQASDAIYEVAAETKMFRWMIEPGNGWMQRIMAIGMFTVPKAMAVKAELEAKKPSEEGEGKGAPTKDMPTMSELRRAKKQKGDEDGE